ncbi:hypothetical protein FRC09_002587 [Ceratobasidium sp. 395]|nr:hypothetical protein FRC09_002587 [Ceratobasidium sp. 395]
MAWLANEGLQQEDCAYGLLQPENDGVYAQILGIRALAGDAARDGLEHQLSKRKEISDEFEDAFEADLRRVRTRAIAQRGRPGCGERMDLELEAELRQVRALYDYDLDDYDPDSDRSVRVLHEEEMNIIMNDHRYSRIRELGFNPTGLDLEYGRASFMALVMEPEAENEVGMAVDVPSGRPRRVPKERLPYTDVETHVLGNRRASGTKRDLSVNRPEKTAPGILPAWGIPNALRVSRLSSAIPNAVDVDWGGDSLKLLSSCNSSDS